MSRRSRSSARAVAHAARDAPDPRRSVWAALTHHQPRHEPHLDGMRGIGCAIVVFCHCALWLPAAFPETYRALPPGLGPFILSFWFGLDIFFVLSGFLIGRILLSQLKRGGLSFRAFYLRRFFRVFPVYYLVLTLSVFVLARIPDWAVLYGGVSWQESFARSWANYLYVSNYVYGMQFPNPLTWGWSLCVEEHFYLATPLLLAVLFGLTKGRGRWLFLAALACAPLLFRWAAYAHSPDIIPFTWLHPMTHTHADGLIFGLLVAYVHVFHADRAAAVVARMGPTTWILGLACYVAVILWGGLWKRGAFPVIGQFFVVSAGSSLVILNGLYRADRLTRFLGSRVWVPFARSSYGMYLTHLFVVFWALGWWPRGTPSPPAAVASVLAYCLVVLAVATALGLVLYVLVERPSLERGEALSRRFLTPPPEDHRMAV